jgi:hypothetical protein
MKKSQQSARRRLCDNYQRNREIKKCRKKKKTANFEIYKVLKFRINIHTSNLRRLI